MRPLILPGQSGLEPEVQLVGAKAVGLFQLPTVWSPRFFVITSEAHDIYKSARTTEFLRNPTRDYLAGEIARVANGGDTLIVRSSHRDEAWAERGRYDSTFCAPTTEDILRVAFELWESLDEETSMPLIVQQAKRHPALGHLSNERRVSRRRTEWLCELDSGETSFATERYQVSSSTVEPRALRCPTYASLRQALRDVAAHLSTPGRPRYHLEWVWDGSRIWIVQRDEEPAPPRSRPLLAGEGVPASPSFELQVLVSPAHAKLKWPKVQCLKEFDVHGLPSPIVFILEDAEEIEAIKRGDPSAALLADLDALCEHPTVVRTDVRKGAGIEGVMLRRTDSVSSRDDVLKFITDASEDLLAKQLSRGEFCFLIHRFVAAQSAAWALARPSNPRVRVDSIWGFPDGLLYYPHDSFEVDVRSSRIERKVRCKPKMLSIGPSGDWLEKSTGQPLDWKSSVTDDELGDIAQKAHSLAAGVGRAVMVMFLIRTDPQTGYPKCLPWVELWEEIPDSARVDASGLLSRPHVVVRTVEDLDRIEQALPIDRKTSLRLQPEPDVLRSPLFMTRVAELAAKQGLPVEFEGSLLSHAFYMLQRKGVAVRTLDPFRPRLRKHVFKKLVRDLIPLRIQSGGEEAKTYRVTPDEILPLLRAKAVEEALEFSSQSDPDLAFMELADLWEVVQSAAKALGRTRGELEKATNEKRRDRGGFQKGVILVETEEVPLLDIINAQQIPGLGRGNRVGSRTAKIGRRVRPRPDRQRLKRHGPWAFSAPLVPPIGESPGSRLSIPLIDGYLEVEVRYSEKEIFVQLSPPQRRAKTDDQQMSLFDPPA